MANMANLGGNMEKALLETLWDFTVPEGDRLRAIECLGCTGKGTMMVTFIELLKLDRSPQIRMATITAMGDLKEASKQDEPAILLLQGIIDTSRSLSIKTQATSTLSKISARHARVKSNKRSTSAKGKHKRSKILKASGSTKSDRSWVVDGKLVTESLKGPG